LFRESSAFGAALGENGMQQFEPRCVWGTSLPDCFSAECLPDALRSAERGDLRWLPEGQAYELSGGSSVTVYRWPGFEVYGALVELSGGYPAAGYLARNVGRNERITLIEGTAEFLIDGVLISLRPRDQVLAREGARYSLRGQGRLVVAVRDIVGASTAIEAGPTEAGPTEAG
jgi:hypothetical protein